MVPSPQSSQGCPTTGHDQFGVMLWQSLAQPPVAPASSQTSPVCKTPSPQRKQRPPAGGQVQPAPRVQAVLQPSPLTALPSSQASLPRRRPLPQRSQRLLLVFAGFGKQL